MPHFMNSHEVVTLLPSDVSAHNFQSRNQLSGRLPGTRNMNFQPWIVSPMERAINHQAGTNGTHQSANNNAQPPSSAARRQSWLDEVGSAAERRASILKTSPAEHFARTQREHRSSPSTLRADAPNFTVDFNHHVLSASAIIDEDVESEDAPNDLPRPQRNSGVYSPLYAQTELPQTIPRASTQDSLPAFPQRPAFAESSQDIAVSRIMPRTASNFAARQLDLPHSVWDARQTFPLSRRGQEHNGHDNQKQPPANRFFDDSQSKLGMWEPTCTLADFQMYPEKDFGSATLPSPYQRLSHDQTCYAVVEFKLFRAEVYQMDLRWSVEEGVSLVKVEADRGQDLGQVYMVTTDLEEARKTKKSLYKKHWDSLLKYYHGAPGPNEFEAAFDEYYTHQTSSVHASGVSGGMAPKAITGRPTASDIQQLQNKEGAEERAKRDGQRRAGTLGLKMDILAAEFQFDMQKLTLYYWSDSYIHYGQLSNEIYKLYKCRLWFGALNPKSFAPPHQKMMEPPQYPKIPPHGMLARQPSYSDNFLGESSHTYFSSNNNKDENEDPRLRRNSTYSAHTLTSPRVQVWNNRTSPVPQPPFNPQLGPIAGPIYIAGNGHHYTR